MMEDRRPIPACVEGLCVISVIINLPETDLTYGTAVSVPPDLQANPDALLEWGPMRDAVRRVLGHRQKAIEQSESPQ